MRHKLGFAIAVTAFLAILSWPVATQQADAEVRTWEPNPSTKLAPTSDILTVALVNALANCQPLGCNSLGRIYIKIRTGAHDPYSELLTVALANAVAGGSNNGPIARIIHVPQD